MTAGTFALPLLGVAPNRAGQTGPGGRRAGLRQFIGGGENRLLEVVAQAAAAGHSAFNPLVFYGPSGVGKLHIALGLARAWKANYPSANVVYLAATDLSRSISGSKAVSSGGSTGALETSALDTDAHADRASSQPTHRTADYLVVDNVDTIAQSAAAQNELAHTIDAVCHRGGRVVLTAILDPARNRAWTPRLRSRLSAGLVAPISPPSAAARARILRELATAHGIALSACCVRLLADSQRRTAPELLGMLLQLELEARSGGHTIDEPQVVARLEREPAARRITVEMIAAAVAKHFHVKADELRSPSRKRSLVLARGVAIYLARKHTRASFVSLGRLFGGRDHTTVMHAHGKTARDMTDDAAVAAAVAQLEASLDVLASTEVLASEVVEADMVRKLSAPCRSNMSSSP
jgi:chromosomal replication initiator protein